MYWPCKLLLAESKTPSGSLSNHPVTQQELRNEENPDTKLELRNGNKKHRSPGQNLTGKAAL